MDSISKEHRSWNMSRIKSKDTIPELKVRSFLHQSGYRFRINRKDLPGNPDIVLPKYKTIVFVHGCFWHRHTNCRRCTTPKSNQIYWNNKFQQNIKRDKENIESLFQLGWKTIVVWECEVRKSNYQIIEMKLQNEIL